MAEVNADLERSLEGPVKKFLSRGLFGARPPHECEGILGRRKCPRAEILRTLAP